MGEYAPASGVAGLTLKRMMTLGSFTNRDFTNTWNIDSAVNPDGPCFRKIYFFLSASKEVYVGQDIIGALGGGHDVFAWVDSEYYNVGFIQREIFQHQVAIYKAVFYVIVHHTNCLHK